MRDFILLSSIGAILGVGGYLLVQRDLHTPKCGEYDIINNQHIVCLKPK